MERPVRRQASGSPHSLPEKPSAEADGVFTFQVGDRPDATAGRVFTCIMEISAYLVSTLG